MKWQMKEILEKYYSLLKISETVTLMIEKVIQVFLAKAKEVKKKIGKFFGGGDDHDFR